MICLYKTAGSVLVVHGIGAVANGNAARATLRNVTPCQAFHATCRRGPYGGNIGGIRSLKNAIRTTLLRPSAMWLTSDKPLRCKGLQRIAKYGNMISRGVGNIWQSFQIGGYECIKREYVTPIKRGAIAVFVDVGSSSSRWFRRREGRSRVFCFPTKEMNREERLSKSSFTRLPNVKGTVAEDARITGSPLRSELASVLREKMALSGHLIFLGQGKGSGDRR